MKSSLLFTRCASLGLIAIIAIPNASAAATFTDVPADAWFAPYVGQAADLGIVSGYRDNAGNLTGKFGPGDRVSVAQSLKMEIGTLGIDASKYHLVPSSEFSTPDPSLPLPYSQTWWYMYYQIARVQGARISGCGLFSHGMGDPEHGPDRPIKRWEMATLIADIYHLIPESNQFSGSDTETQDQDGFWVVDNTTGQTLPNPYTDIGMKIRLDKGSAIPWPDASSGYSGDALDFAMSGQPFYAILRLTQDGVLTGDTAPDGTRRFRPLDTLNRAEAVKILLKAKETYPASQGAIPPSFDLEDVPLLPCTA